MNLYQFLIADRLKLLFSFFGDSFLFWCKSLFALQPQLIQKIVDSNINLVGSEYAFGYLDFLFGYKSYNNNNIQQSLSEVGLSHLLSASGFFITWLLEKLDLCFSFLHFRSYRVRQILKLVVIAIYWFLSRSSAALSRSLLSVLLSLIVKNLGFSQLNFYRSLILVLVLMWLIDSSQLATLSLRFSLGAVVGIYCLASFFSSWSSGVKFGRSKPTIFNIFPQPESRFHAFVKRFFIKGADQFTFFISVQLGMLPLIAATWGEMAVSSLIANTLLAGVSPVLFSLGLVWLGWLGITQLGYCVGNCTTWLSVPTRMLFWPYLVFGWLAEQLAKLTQFTLKLPQFSAGATVAWYAGLLLIRFFYQRFQTTRIVKRVSLQSFAESLLKNKKNMLIKI